MLTTPKLMPDLVPSPVSMSAVGGSGARGSQAEGEDEMLTTPVLTTPKTSDLWPTLEEKTSADTMGVLNLTRNSPLLAPKHDVLPLSFSPTTLAASSTLSPPATSAASGVRELLPLNSDIGLRSPCDGLLAKRRKYKLKQSGNNETSQENSSNQTSPRDLSKNGGNSSSTSGLMNSQEGDERLHNNGSHDVASIATTTTSTKTSSTKMSLAESLPTDFKLPRKSLPSHYTPSPLAVPSPNWMAVERYLDMSSKTPKLLDSAIFDFLGPATPRTKHSREGRSPSAIEYQRLSPRFPIPETPTDLSSSKVDVSRLDKSGVNGAQDLSLKTPSSVEGATTAMETGPTTIESIKVESSSSSSTPSPQTTASITMANVKSEHPESNETSLQLSRQAYPYPSSTTMAGHGVLAHPPHTLYDRGFAGCESGPTLPHPFQSMGPLRSHSASPPPPPATAMAVSLAAAAAMQQACYSSHHLWMSGGGAMVSPVARSQLHPTPLPPAWTLPVPTSGMDVEDEEESTSPPPMYPTLHTVAPTPAPAGTGGGGCGGTGTGRGRGRRPTGGSSVGGNPAGIDDDVSSGETAGRRRKGPKGGTKKGNTTNRDGSKRVYACPHCQRTYDWNYNLNRHLKYECGKENAFQCSKCGRKFPHKQNCVYHLKRKHKIVCDTIDEYMVKGLVLFRGAESLTQSQVSTEASKQNNEIKIEPP